MGNYRFCGSSQIGKSHEVDDTVCQDSHFIREGKGFIVAAVADGLGTSKYSDIASKLAANSAVDYCIENISAIMPDDQILDSIHSAFEHANNLIKKEAQEDIDDYDTTLSLAVFREGEVFYGHAGDSGIIALCADGTFEEVTQQQLGEGEGKDRPVFPLINESRWIFDKFNQTVHAVFLMTDGMLNMTVPPLLAEQRYQLDHSYLYYLYEEVRDGDDIKSWIDDEIIQISPGVVNYDDKTLIVIIDGDVAITDQPDEYYEFPSDALYKSLLSQKPMAAAAAPQSVYEKVKGVTSKELWKKNRKMIILVASIVLIFSLSIPITVTFFSGGTINPETGEWERLSFRQAMQHTFNPMASGSETIMTQDEYNEIVASLDEGESILDIDIEDSIANIRDTGSTSTPANSNNNRNNTTGAPTPTPTQTQAQTPGNTVHSCNAHVCIECNRTCTLHVCTICNRTCTLHVCSNTLCNRTCTLHVCSNTLCNRKC